MPDGRWALLVLVAVERGIAVERVQTIELQGFDLVQPLVIEERALVSP